MFGLSCLHSYPLLFNLACPFSLSSTSCCIASKFYCNVSNPFNISPPICSLVWLLFLTAHLDLYCIPTSHLTSISPLLLVFLSLLPFLFHPVPFLFISLFVLSYFTLSNLSCPFVQFTLCPPPPPFLMIIIH